MHTCTHSPISWSNFESCISPFPTQCGCGSTTVSHKPNLHHTVAVWLGFCNHHNLWTKPSIWQVFLWRGNALSVNMLYVRWSCVANNFKISIQKEVFDKWLPFVANINVVSEDCSVFPSLNGLTVSHCLTLIPVPCPYSCMSEKLKMWGEPCLWREKARADNKWTTPKKK